MHSIKVHAPVSRIYSAISDLTGLEIPLVRALLAIRALPARIRGKAKREIDWGRPVMKQVLCSGFVLLAEEPGREIVLGTIGQFWKLSGGAPSGIKDAQDFMAFSRPGFAKAAINFQIEAGSDGSARVSTETRIRALDPLSRRKFAGYWRVIYVGSVLIRRMWLRSIKRRAERGVVLAPAMRG